MLGIEKEITGKWLKMLGGQRGVKITKELINTIKNDAQLKVIMKQELPRKKRSKKPKN